MPVQTRAMYKKQRLAKAAARLAAYFVRPQPVETRSASRKRRAVLAELKAKICGRRRAPPREPAAPPSPKPAASERPRAGPYSWVAATSLRNAALNDHFLDWVDYHFAAYARRMGAELPPLLLGDGRGARSWVPATAEPRVGSDPGTTRRQHSAFSGFTEYVMHQGDKFEAKVVAHLYRAFGAANVVDLHGEPAAATIRELRRGTPILCGAYVQHESTLTYGITDLIVRADWLKKLVARAPLAGEAEAVAAPRLGHQWHYRVVDVKCSTLPLRSDGEHLLNSGSVPAYKSQLYVYHRALAHMQGYDPGEAYLLGKRWAYTSRKVTFRGTSCFDRLGVVAFGDVDAEVGRRTDERVRWVNHVREHGADWDPLAPPYPCAELYPNMSNKYDYPWRPVKEFFAVRNAELTSLWMCGPKNRAAALARGVYRWTDPGCTCEALDVTTGYRGPILERILAFNRDEDSKTPLAPAALSVDRLPRPGGLEFFVDFESVNDVVLNDDFSTFPISNYATFIFMIGVGYREPRTKTWVFRHFTVDELTVAEQDRICAEFEQYVARIVAYAPQTAARPPVRMYHWGSAEQSLWRGAGRIAPPRATQWYDLLGLFRAEPITVKGCLDFGLKNVATAMHRHGLIQTTWNAASSCTDGATAMLRAAEAYRECRQRGVPCAGTPKIAEIQQYNETDCKVLLDIVEYLRASHTKY